MPQGQFTQEYLRNNDQFNYLSDPDYIQGLQSLLNGRQQLLDLEQQQYNAQKINDTRSEITNKFMAAFTEFYANYVNQRKKTMTDIEQSYNQPTRTEYLNDKDALNEMLRRQDVEAEYALMSDNELQKKIDESLDEVIALPLYDQNVIVSELKKRGIDLDLAKFQLEQKSKYKSDPNWKQAMNELNGIAYCRPQGRNTVLGLLEPADNGQSNMQFKTINEILNASDQEADLMKMGLSYMNGIGHRRNSNHYAAAGLQAANDLASGKDKAKEITVADNDPRINQEGSKYNWSVLYDFLSERFGDDPRITSNPIYSEVSSPVYDISKRYDMLMSIYKEKQLSHEYSPIKIIDTHNVDPETMPDKDIKKIFGTPFGVE